ncbi:MAG: hypothetical protein J7M38_08745 [Armatimonadetes bacterium]|nr:hypothetical protein [Armatimonadota bacterium]
MLDENTCEELFRKLAALRLWYLRRVIEDEGLDPAEADHLRVGLFRMTVFAGNATLGIPENRAGWEAVLPELVALYERRAEDADTTELEREGLELLWPHMEPVIAWTIAADARFLEKAIGCFQHEFRPCYADPDAGDHLTLHIRNAFAPDSPFHHLPEMADSLLEVTARAARERPDVEWIQCGSWLNSVPPFASLFPPSWSESAQPGAPGSHMGWWGQFQNRRGGFHERNAARFRATGQFPYQHLLCRCPVAELNEHLKTFPHD